MRASRWIESVDRRATGVAQVGRRSRRFDRAMYLLSAAGDDGRIWFAATAVEAARHDRHWATAQRALVWLGIESVLVNGPLKWGVRRGRPDRTAMGLRDVRVPKNSSFPSGHAASAATMATILSEDSPLGPLWWGLALGIAWSRVHVGVHHPTDVFGGLAVGTAIGWVARTVQPLGE